MSKSKKNNETTVITLGAERSITAFLTYNKSDNNILRPSDSDYTVQYADWGTLPHEAKIKSRSQWLYSLLKALSRNSKDYKVKRIFAKTIKPKRFECLGFRKGEGYGGGEFSSAFFDGSALRMDTWDDCKSKSNNEPKKPFGIAKSKKGKYIFSIYAAAPFDEYSDKKIIKHLKKLNKLLSAGKMQAEVSLVIGAPLGRIINDTDSLNYILSHKNIARRSILVMSVESLRKAGLNVRKGVSWEQLFSETLAELKTIKELNDAYAVVVSYQMGGCLVWVPSTQTFEMLYCADELEDDYFRSCDRDLLGTMAILQSTIVNALARGKGSGAEEIFDGVQHGMIAMRALFDRGYKLVATKHGREEITLDVDAVNSICSDMNANDQTLGPESPYKQYEVFECFELRPDFINSDFSIMNLLIPREKMPFLAKQYVRLGKRALKEYSDCYPPHLEVGSLITFERKEIEKLNNIKHLFEPYISKGGNDKPLSLCVFGNPGSGKSFAVKEIAKSIALENICFLEFNLSKMTSINDLADAFHKIADAGLNGVIPIAFFDEFDSELNGNKLGWLKFFLSPMQDGTYRSGRSDYILGKAIFVFAGGTCITHEEFETLAKKNSETKSKDFLSRIKGYLDVAGVNPATNKDPIPYLKRAILVRSLILKKIGSKNNEEVLDIDDKVLDAFLLTREFYHDARSIEIIINTSRLIAGIPFTPARIENNCLDMHADREFQDYLKATSIKTRMSAESFV